MTVQIFVESVICFLALLGIYSVVQWLVRRLCGSRQTVLAIEILTQRDAEAAEMLIRDALFSALGLPSGRIVILMTKELVANERLMETIKRYGADYYLVEEKL